MVLGLRRRLVCGHRDAALSSGLGCEPLRPCRSLVAAPRRGAVASREGEEAGTTPGSAGDGACDGREASIGRALPVEAIERDCDGVALALIVAHQHRAGLELAPGRAAVACQTIQEPQAFPIEAAKGSLLQAPSNHSPQHINRNRAQTSDLSLDRGRVRQVLAHGYALA